MRIFKISLLVFFILIVTFIYHNWGFWRSKTYELTGKEFPLERIYATDISNRGREAGLFIRIYKLPENINSLLSTPNYDLSQYPILVAGFERDNYTRINWKKKFPTDKIDEYINGMIHSSHEKSDSAILSDDHFKINNDAQAVQLLDYLKGQPDTYYCGWYKDGQEFHGTIFIPHFYFYVINPTQRLLIMFGLDT